MTDFEDIMKELEGKETDIVSIRDAVTKHGPLPVKIALLGIATTKRLYNPYWIGCPPAVFLSYKWNGPASREYVEKIHDYLVKQGYAVHFDKVSLGEDADTFTEVPAFISYVGESQYYVLVLTEKTADFITARNKKTSWIFDEYQQALMLANSGRLQLVPLLVEEKGATDFFTPDNTINLVNDIYNFSKLEAVFYPINFKLTNEQKIIFTDFLDGCDVLIMQKKWKEAVDFLNEGIWFKNFPDYQFRLLIVSRCIQNKEIAEVSFAYVADFTGMKQLNRLLNAYAEIYRVDFSAPG
jgi:hypothetical protein